MRFSIFTPNKINGFMFLYKLVRPIATLGVKTYFKKIYFHNDHFIPSDKPVLITCNHPTAFLDPIMLACFLKQPIHFMVRGDVFKKPFYRSLLQSLNMIPIFRMKDGLANVKSNFDIMDYVCSLLVQKQHIVFFAEGGCTQEKRLRPIQKGTARQAFQAIEKHGELDIHICPASVNYGLKTQVRDTVKFDFGPPISVLDYLETYRQNPNKAIKELTDEIQKRMRLLIVHIESDDDRVVVEQIQELIENQYNAPLLPVKDADKIPLRYDRLVANTVNDMSDDDKNNLKIDAHKYFEKLKKSAVTDFGILHRDFNNVWTKINLVLGFLPFLIGKIVLYPCWIYGKITADKRVGMGKNVEFYSSVRFGVSTFMFLWFYITLIISSLFVNNGAYYLFVAIVPFLCFFNLAYREYHQKWEQARKGSFLDQKQYKELMERREALLKGFF